MATSSRRRIDESSPRSSVRSYGPQFFKIMHNGIVDDPKLRIPREFTKKYGKHLSNLVFLEVPTGAIWKVELVDSDGDFWLQNGWQEFKEYYSIGYGHLLVFRYDGNSRFHVLIFDMSASEIEYPVSVTHVEQTKNTRRKVLKTDVIEADDSVEILDDFPTSQTKEKIPEIKQLEKDVSLKSFDDDLPTLHTSKTIPICEVMMSTNFSCKREKTTNLEALFPDFQCRGIQTNGMKLAKSNADRDSNYLTREIKKECTGSGDTVTTMRRLHTKVPERRKSLTEHEKFRALQRAKDYKSEDPFLPIVMQPSYLRTKKGLSIPLVFAKKYFGDKQNIILRVSDGRTWSVKCNFGEKDAKFSSGWKSFVDDNNIKVGDVCVFQLIKGIEPSLKVIIF